MGQRKKEDLNIPTMILCIIGAVLTVFGILVLKNDNLRCIRKIELEPIFDNTVGVEVEILEME